MAISVTPPDNSLIREIRKPTRFRLGSCNISEYFFFAICYSEEHSGNVKLSTLKFIRKEGHKHKAQARSDLITVTFDSLVAPLDHPSNAML